jgi:hypothetical protein
VVTEFSYCDLCHSSTVSRVRHHTDRHPQRPAIPGGRHAGQLGSAPSNPWKLPPGRRVPSESDLEQIYGMARGTARKAIAVLRDEGLIETVRGKGSFVVTDP